MVEKDIVEGKIGDVGSYDVEFKGGKLVCKAGIAKEATPGVSVKADLSIEIEATKVIDAIEKAIPGHFDDIALELLKKLLTS